jgi:hypothetical protein
MRCLELGVEAADVVEEFDCEVVAGLFDRAGWGEDLEEPIDVRSVDVLGDPAPGELGQQCVHAAHEPSPVVADVGVALGQETQRASLWPTASSRRSPRERRAAIATESASFGSFLFDRPVESTRTRTRDPAWLARPRRSPRRPPVAGPAGSRAR